MRGWERLKQAQVEKTNRHFKQEAAARRLALLVQVGIPLALLLVLLGVAAR